MNRRGFFGALCGATIAASVATESEVDRFGAKPGLETIAVLPEEIKSLTTCNGRLFACTSDSLYEIFPDGAYAPVSFGR